MPPSSAFFEKSPLYQKMVAELDLSIANSAACAKKLRRGAAILPHDDAEPLRELAAIYELKAVLFINYRNKWFGEGGSRG